FADVIGNEPSLKVDYNFAFFGIDLGDLSNIPVVDILLVIIDCLEDFIPRGIGPAKLGEAWRRLRIEGLLEHGVEGPRTETPPVHRGQDLDIANRMESKALGNPCRHDPQ